MEHSSEVIDLAAWRERRRNAMANWIPCLTILLDPVPAERPSGKALEARQRETLEKLRALGYEISHPRRD